MEGHALAGDMAMKSSVAMNMKVIGYWAATSIVIFELVVGGLTDLVHGRTVLLVGPSVVAVITQLGYPVYLLTILGWWKLLGAAALLAPRLPRLKEWAYAGVFFEMTGALASHIASGQYSISFVWAIIVTVTTLVSWALRPPGRILGALCPAKANTTIREESPPLSSTRAG
jgi:hypothetical protein